jgi:hypothetical protein
MVVGPRAVERTKERLWLAMLAKCHRGRALIRTPQLRRLVLLRGIPCRLRGELWEVWYTQSAPSRP